jgi:D-psicose/D-tagatose/L-ribulose 3-epimerase
MNPIGANTWIWTSPLTDEHLDLVGRVKELGFDVIELAVEDTALVSAELWRAAGEDAGVAFAVCGAFGPDRDLAHEDARIRGIGLEYLKALVDYAVALDAPVVAGPMYSAVGRTEMLPSDVRERQRERAAEGIREAADYAAGHGVRLGIEPLNRFETDLVNTCAQALELCDRVDRDNVGVHLDTFHGTIEEKSVPDAIRLAGERLFHVHTCENDRGTPGTGHVPWADVFRALDEVGYEGQLVIESFTPDVKEIARAASIWRPLDAAGDELARGGAAFLREAMLGAAAAAV